MVNVAIVAALCSSTGAIGHEGRLPWNDRLVIDMSFFRLITTVPWFLSPNDDETQMPNMLYDKACCPISSANILFSEIPPSSPSCSKNRFKLNFGDLSSPIKHASNVVIMGRKTADSIPVHLPLINRITVVLTKNFTEYHQCSSNIYRNEKGVFYAKDFSTIQDDLPSLTEISNILVIGGAQIYSEFLKAGIASHLFLTFVTLKKETALTGADVYFPPLPKNYQFIQNITFQVAMSLFEWTSTPENAKRLLKEQLDTGEILKTGLIKEEKGHLLQFLWFQKISK